MLDEIDCMLNPAPVCPCCGAECSDPWELGLEDGGEIEIDCDGCERAYIVTCGVRVTYDTRVKPEEAKP